MKKSSFFRIISLVLISLFLLSLTSCTSYIKDFLEDNSSEKDTAVVYYNTMGGVLPKGIKSATEYEKNDVIKSPPIPKKDGYKFDGWILENDAPALFPFTVKRTVTLTATWKEVIDTVAVTYKLNGGQLPKDVEDINIYEVGTKIASFPTPTKDNFKFLGWFIGNNEVTFPYIVNNNVVIVARWEQIEAEIGTETETEIEIDTETTTETVTETETETETETTTETATEVETETDTTIGTETESDTSVESTDVVTDTETDIVTETETDTQTEIESDTEVTTDTETVTNTEIVTDTETEATTDTETIETDTETETEIDSETDVVMPDDTDTESLETETEIITDTETTTETDAPADTETEAPADAETEASTDTETEATTETEVDTEVTTDTETEAPADTETEAPADTETEAPADTEPEAPTDTEPETDSVTDTDTEIATETETETETEAPVLPSKVTLTFDPNGGEIIVGLESRQATPGKNFTLVPEVELDGHIFLYWATEDGEPIEIPFTVPSEDTTYYAIWQTTVTDVETETETETEATVTVTLDVNGGTLPDGKEAEFQAVVGSKFGTNLPTPTRMGYTFLGWYEDGNEDLEITKRSLVEDYDMEIVAIWEANGEIIMVEFNLTPDETISSDFTYFEMVAGERISSFIDSMPTATKYGYRFLGWQSQSGAQVTLTSILNEDTILSPTWEKLILCVDGTENHQWSVWQWVSDASCTTDGKESRACTACGVSDYIITEEAYGHSFGSWTTITTTDGVFRSRSCVNCDETETDALDNITYERFNIPSIDGDCWGGDKGASLVNGSYTDRDMCGKGTGALTVSLTAKSSTYVDIFTVTGYGSASYFVTVYYANGTYKDIGTGSFGEGDTATKAFTIEDTVTKIVVTMPSPSNGTDYWSELSAFVVPTND